MCVIATLKPLLSPVSGPTLPSSTLTRDSFHQVPLYPQCASQFPVLYMSKLIFLTNIATWYHDSSIPSPLSQSYSCCFCLFSNFPGLILWKLSSLKYTAACVCSWFFFVFVCLVFAFFFLRLASWMPHLRQHRLVVSDEYDELLNHRVVKFQLYVKLKHLI